MVGLTASGLESSATAHILLSINNHQTIVSFMTTVATVEKTEEPSTAMSEYIKHKSILQTYSGQKRWIEALTFCIICTFVPDIIERI